MHILVTGGVRSGKTEFAESLALERAAEPIYVSTCESDDPASLERLAKGAERRGKNWTEMVAPTNLAGALTNSDVGRVRLVDNLTLWSINLMYHQREWRVPLKAVINALERQKSPVIFIADEIGLGIAPEGDWSQALLDIVGEVNMTIAKHVKEAHFVVAGCPLRLK